MIVHTSCVKVGHRQAPQNTKPSPLSRAEGFGLLLDQKINKLSWPMIPEIAPSLGPVPMPGSR